MRITPVQSGIAVILAAVLVYIWLLGEPGFLFYPFAAIALIAAPLIAGFQGGIRAGVAVLALAVFSLLSIYAIQPEFERTSVRLPAVCGAFPDSTGSRPTVTLTGDAQTDVVVAIDSKTPPFPSTVSLVRKSDKQTLWSTGFDDDFLAAGIDGGILYLYDDKLGYWIDTRNGQPRHELFTIDNYGGLSPTDRPVFVARAPTGHWYMETSAVISSWNRDGSVIPRRRYTFNATAFNCFINGTTGGVTPLWPAPPAQTPRS